MTESGPESRQSPTLLVGGAAFSGWVQYSRHEAMATLADGPAVRWIEIERSERFLKRKFIRFGDWM